MIKAGAAPRAVSAAATTPAMTWRCAGGAEARRPGIPRSRRGEARADHEGLVDGEGRILVGAGGGREFPIPDDASVASHA